MTKPQKTDELAILLPNREVVIAGETLTVREYTLKDIMQHSQDIDNFVTPLSQLMGKRESIPYDETNELIKNHYEAVLILIAYAINKPFDYVLNLNANEGYILIDTWWTVNSPFFINAAVRKIILKSAADKTLSDGDAFLASLSSTDTIKTT